jgi:hypothetical protein
MKRRIAISVMICLFVLGSGSLAEADHVYVSFGVALGGVAVGALGVGFYFLFPAHGEIAQVPPTLQAGLLNLAQNKVSWSVPDLEIRTTESLATGPQGIEGYACLFRLRW